MYLIYKPAQGDEQRWKYDPNKLMSAEREAIERRTGRDFTDFTQGVVSGNSLCRRALLHTLLRRTHPTVRWEDVDFAWDELNLEFSRQEYLKMREAIAEDDSLPEGERAEALADIDAEITTAIDEDQDGTEGKAQPTTGE